MTFSNQPTNGQICEKGNRTKVYTVEEVITTVRKQYLEKKSLRRVAKEDYQGRVTFGDVQRMIKGIEPLKPQVRLAFGLQPMAPAPICLRCGEVHVTKKCTSTTSTQPRQRRPLPREHQEQMALFQMAAIYEHDYPELMWMFAVPNGGLRNKAVAGKLKAEGVKSGVPDIWLPVARDNFHGLVIELKVEDGRLSDNQKKWIQFLNEHGYLALEIHGADLAFEILTAYLAEKSVNGKTLYELLLANKYQNSGEYTSSGDSTISIYKISGTCPAATIEGQN